MGNECFEFTINDPIFKKQFHVFVGNRLGVIKIFDKLNLYAPIKGATLFEKDFAGLYVSLQGVDDTKEGYQVETSIIWIDSFDYSTIVHECFHAVFDSLKTDSVDLSESTNEVFAYYLGFMVTSVVGEFKKRNFQSK